MAVRDGTAVSITRRGSIGAHRGGVRAMVELHPDHASRVDERGKVMVVDVLASARARPEALGAVTLPQRFGIGHEEVEVVERPVHDRRIQLGHLEALHQHCRAGVALGDVCQDGLPDEDDPRLRPPASPQFVTLAHEQVQSASSASLERPGRRRSLGHRRRARRAARGRPGHPRALPFTVARPADRGPAAPAPCIRRGR